MSVPREHTRVWTRAVPLVGRGEQAGACSLPHSGGCARPAAANVEKEYVRYVISWGQNKTAIITEYQQDPTLQAVVELTETNAGLT
ncbi:hypothetical protein NDU88_010524 [Pleurodeles waltl]|uniref:Uncharacterized protein n=1 Tax=Pleurodeles waltl TaxID=8319 RepID=A0AAV7R0K5_PLEWA|nr:hypothetical protein NDU88_010524 [Pleurodeles waltl]